jgi:hypothetical protein
MIRRINLFAAAVAFMLSACTSGQQLSQSVPAAGGAGFSHSIPPPKDCGGTGGVTVAPCPVHLTRHTKQGIVVTVSGPGVVNSDLGHITGCFNGHTCYNAEREGSSQTQWRITSGRVCGAADVEFDGVDAYGNTVGYYFLKVANKYCRHRH